MNKQPERIIILDGCKFDWTPKEIEQAKALFSQGVPPTEVAKIMKQDVVDIGLLLIHLINKKKLKESNVES